MSQGLNAIAVLAFAFSSVAAHGQDVLPFHDAPSRAITQLPAGLTLTLRHSIPVDRTRLLPVYAQHGRIVTDILSIRMGDSFCMLATASSIPSSAVGTDLNGQSIVVGTVTPTVTRTYDRSSDSYVSRRSFFINNNVAAGGSPLLVGIVCNTSSTSFTLRELQRAFGPTLDMTVTLPADLSTVIRDSVLNQPMAFTGWYSPMRTITAFEGVDRSSCLGVALSNIAHYFYVDAEHTRFVERVAPLLDSIRARGAEIAPESCAADGSHLHDVDEEDSSAGE